MKAKKDIPTITIWYDDYEKLISDRAKLIKLEAQQNTLTHDKVVDVIIDNGTMFGFTYNKQYKFDHEDIEEAATTICKLTIPKASEIGKPEDCARNCVGPDCEGCKKFEPILR